MAKFLSVISRPTLTRIVEPLARALLRIGVSPNAVTVAGSVGVVAIAVTLGAHGHLVLATLLITVCALTDLLDGTMARLRGSTGKWGALLDSTVDRVSDAAVLGAVVYWMATTGQHRGATVALVALILGQIVSYVKARAEGLGFKANVGIAERAERLLIVGVGGFLTGLGLKPALEVALWVLALLSAVTIGQRMIFVYRQAREPIEP